MVEVDEEELTAPPKETPTPPTPPTPPSICEVLPLGRPLFFEEAVVSAQL